MSTCELIDIKADSHFETIVISVFDKLKKLLSKPFDQWWLSQLVHFPVDISLALAGRKVISKYGT